MARQSTTPVSFGRTIRRDTAVTMTSGRAGVVIPVAYIPLLAGDGCGGRAGIDVQLAEMPKPLLNGVHANFQAWFVPKSAHPQFPGRDELMHARTGQNIKALGAADRAPPAFFTEIAGATLTTAAASAFFKSLGLHIPTGAKINSDLIDAFSVIYNFRLAAHSSRLTRRKYASEDIAEATSLPPAFWPSSRFSRVVPDYERALLVGALDLDVLAGSMTLGGVAPVLGLGAAGDPGAPTSGTIRQANGVTATTDYVAAGNLRYAVSDPAAPATRRPNIRADLTGIVTDLAGGAMTITLSDIDKARTTQAFAKLRSAYAGNDATGFDNDDTIVALLMQGIEVQPDDFKRPWLLDSQRVPVGFAERFATDAANLDASVTQGRASATLSLNVPVQDVSGVVIITVEVLPERVDERMSDEWLLATEVDHLPNALRDVQRVEPVDMVLNRRVDAKHSTPGGLYGYEPMNDKWNRDFTRLGGDFYMATPGGGWTENRSNIWQTEIIDPAFTSTHYLAPAPFPHDVFADTLGSAFEVVCRHMVSVNGLTQIGDVLAENNDDYDAVQEAGL